MNLSKSKYCNGIQCKKMLWLYEKHPELADDVANSSVLDNGTEVGKLAKNLFGKYTDIPFSEDLEEMIDNTKKALIDGADVITEASFLYDNNFCSVDILRRVGDSYDIYEVKSSTEVKDIYIDDASYQYYVLKKSGINVRNCYIVHINSNYVRDGELDLNELFSIQDITDHVLVKQSIIPGLISDFKDCADSKDEPTLDIGEQCFKPYDCPFFGYCSRHLKKPNIFDIRGMNIKTKFKLYRQGKSAFSDLIYEKLNKKYIQQIDYELNDRPPYINKEAIKAFLDTLSYPLYFLDFETFQQPIPMFNGVRPYMQIPFQYSLHYIETENGVLKHKEFLGDGVSDPRRALAERLVEDIPMNSCSLAYNMMFEKMVIKNLAQLYPDLSEHLMNIHDNMKDLMIPFINRDYYCKAMQGSYSIKYVLPALYPNDPELDYHNLEDIHNGVEAMNGYANLSKLPLEEQELLRKNMLKYCGLDTFAMVKVLKKIKDVCK